MNMLHEWRQSCVGKHKFKAVSSVSPRRWSPPQQGWVKANVDAAVFMESGCIGIGCVIRDEYGSFVGVRSQRIEALYQPPLSWVKELGYKKCVFETDAKALTDACKSVQGRAYFHSIVLSCVDLFKHYDEVLVDHVHRFANGVAHKLVRATHSVSDIHE